MLIELPNGDWIDPKVVQALRFLDDDWHGPRVGIDAQGTPAWQCLMFDDAESARGWMKKFGTDCNAALASEAAVLPHP